ncbi:MAG: SpaA isopeptide-forming pilin-related protein [Eubacteriales bacterium]|nr:SpaA isopeptide-forming pilin-related protein [Eubacteriales bacterium]
MKKKKGTHGEINYWQSNTDLMSALVLVLLLIIMLLILYLMQIPENSQPDAEVGDSYNVDDELGDETQEAYHYPETENDEDSGGNDDKGEDEEEEDDGTEDYDGDGGGGSGTGIGTDPEYNYEYPLPTHNGEDWNKAAVYATVVDEETGRAIREAGITFELYEEQVKGDGGALRFLNTYYPEKIEYRNYETTEEGVFYLPEKVEEGHYYFKQITELEGYDLTEAVPFDIDDIYDWPDPYVVSIEISPSKNVIPITIEDMETHEPLLDGTFQVTAAEDIITADNSVRYARNELADTVTFDEEGYGESKELYLGQYTVTQGTIPQYYASIKHSTDVTVEKKDGSIPEALKFSCEKTKIKLKLTDELYTNLKLEGAEFALICEKDPELSKSAVTDKNGEIIFTDLEKNTTYQLQQISAPENYKFDDTPAEIFVSEEGRIEDEAEISLDLMNYVVRVTVDAKDELFGKPVSNANMALYNSDDELIRTWTTSGSAETFENLPGGSYYVLLNGDKNKKYEFEFAENKALQEFSVTIWTMQNIVIAAAGGCILLFGIFAVTMLLKKKKPSDRKETRKETKREE